MESYQYYVIVDLEATCCNAQSIARTEMEIIEIGAVCLNAKSLEIIDEFCTLVKPVRHPRLTQFCTGLTSIRQQDVDAAPDFASALGGFLQWLKGFDNYLFCSWGDYDKSQLQQDCQYHGLPMPIQAPHLNIKARFSQRQGLEKKYGMAQALRLCGLPLQGVHHRGIDDARNMARMARFIFGDARITR
jgi:inhibitor of KinA sporulation pathway (predicted exonuclease)